MKFKPICKNCNYTVLLLIAIIISVGVLGVSSFTAYMQQQLNEKVMIMSNEIIDKISGLRTQLLGISGGVQSFENELTVVRDHVTEKQRAENSRLEQLAQDSRVLRKRLDDVIGVLSSIEMNLQSREGEKTNAS